MSKLYLLLVLVMSALASPAFAQQSVINQATTSSILTKNDTTVYSPPTKALFIGDATACNVALMLLGDTVATTFSNVQSGQVLPFQVKKLMSTNTTCTVVVGLY